MIAEKSYRVDARAAARKLGVHAETMRRWARDGKVPARKVLSGHWMFNEEDLHTLNVHVVTESIEIGGGDGGRS